MPENKDAKSALYRAADRATRRSAMRATAFLVIAAIAAVGSAFLLTRYMESRAMQARVPTTDVLVADRDLPIGTELQADHLRAIAWPSATLPEGTFADPKQLEGKAVAVHVYRGEVILAPKLAGGDAAGSLAARLPAGMRAAAVRVDDVVGVAGFIHPGDSVDVIATLRAEGVSSVTSSRVILQNIRVLAVGKEVDRSRSERVVPATVATVMVNADQSERLALAASQGKILLTLRSAADTTHVVTTGITPGALLSVRESSPPPAPAVVVAAAPKPPRHSVRHRVAEVVPPPPPQKDVVEIMRGDVFERRDFQKESKR